LIQEEKDFIDIQRDMIKTIKRHRGNVGGIFNSYNIDKIQRIENRLQQEKYNFRKRQIEIENNGQANERRLYHGNQKIYEILQNGFDERMAKASGLFGAGIYFASHSSKSNQYVQPVDTGCCLHNDKSCYQCTRTMIVCRVSLGNSKELTQSSKLSHAPPGFHSVTGVPSAGWLSFPEYVVYRGEQALPEFLVTYRIVNEP
jgi:tankyrase